jgi:hypothetical protein
MKILVCSATPVEGLACERGIEKSGVAGFEVFQTGMGIENARQALKTHFYKGKPDLVISSGFAGIWSGEIEVGQWVGASEIWSKIDNAFSRVPCLLKPSPAEISGSVVSVDKIGPIPSELPEELDVDRIIVDMESAGLAQICQENEIAFSVFRMITDTPQKPLPQFVSSWTAAFQSPRWEDKFNFGAIGLMEVAQNIGTVKKFLVEGRQWALDLEKGWQENAAKF